MKVTTVSYGRTVNLGNFESARLDATAELEPGDTREDVPAQLRAWIDEQAESEWARKGEKPTGWKA